MLQIKVFSIKFHTKKSVDIYVYLAHEQSFGSPKIAIFVVTQCNKRLKSVQKQVIEIRVLEISNINISQMVCPIEVILSPNERRVVRASFHSVYNITHRKIRLLVGWWDSVITRIATGSGWKYFYLLLGMWYGRIIVWKMFRFRPSPTQKSCRTSYSSSFQLPPPPLEKWSIQLENWTMYSCVVIEHT